MNKTISRFTLWLAIGLLAVASVQAGSLEPPPGPVSTTHPPDTCYDNTGNRFVDCGDGTIKDTETGLFWLKNASCFFTSWATVHDLAANLAHGQCGLTDGSLPGDWRLPTLECPSGTGCSMTTATGEFATIFAASCPAPHVPDTAGTGCWSPGDPFESVLSDNYWSATTFAPVTTSAWVASLGIGNVGQITKSFGVAAWPVRSGP